MHQYSYKVQQPYPDKTLSVYVLFSVPFPNKQLKPRHHNIMKMYIDWLFRQENDFPAYEKDGANCTGRWKIFPAREGFFISSGKRQQRTSGRPLSFDYRKSPLVEPEAGPGNSRAFPAEPAEFAVNPQQTCDKKESPGKIMILLADRSLINRYK